MRNTPVLLSLDGGAKPCVFPDFMTGGQCTATTRRGRRCRNDAWDQGQVAQYAVICLGDRMLTVYGPLYAEAERRYLTQRCQVHDTPDAQADCDPEWELFDIERHYDLTDHPTVAGIFGYPLILPPVRPLALALRDYFSEAERQLFADILTGQDPAR